MPDSRYIRNDLSVWLGEELRRVRCAAGYHSQDQLAHKLGFDRTVITKIETGKRPASDDTARALLTMFPDLAGGRFGELSEIARKERGVIPGWFADWIEAEKTAAVVKWWEPLLIPGLLQTAEYARALFIAWQMVGTEDEMEGLLSTRMARQTIFDRANPPRVWAVIDETVLHRAIGGPHVMRDQLLRLVELSMRPRIAVHIVPADVGAHIGLLGAFAIADFDDDTPGIVYMESPEEGHSSRNPATVAKINLTFDTLRNEALPRGASRDLIVKVAEERWT